MIHLRTVLMHATPATTTTTFVSRQLFGNESKCAVCIQIVCMSHACKVAPASPHSLSVNSERYALKTTFKALTDAASIYYQPGKQGLHGSMHSA